MRGIRGIHSSSFVAVAGHISYLVIRGRDWYNCLHHPVDLYASCKKRTISYCRFSVSPLLPVSLYRRFPCHRFTHVTLSPRLPFALSLFLFVSASPVLRFTASPRLPLSPFPPVPDSPTSLFLLVSDSPCLRISLSFPPPFLSLTMRRNVVHYSAWR